MKKTIDLKHLQREEIATLLDVTTKSIEVWTKQEANPLPYHFEGTIKYYIWSECLQWHVNNKIIKYQKFKPADEITEAKLEGINLQNQKLQMEIDEKEELLLNASDVKQVWSDSLVTIRQNLLNVGHVAATEIIDGMKYKTKKNLIDALIFSNLDKVIKDARDNNKQEEGK